MSRWKGFPHSPGRVAEYSARSGSANKATRKPAGDCLPASGIVHNPITGRQSGNSVSYLLEYIKIPYLASPRSLSTAGRARCQRDHALARLMYIQLPEEAGHAGVAEWADAWDLKSQGRKVVQVRVLSPAPLFQRKCAVGYGNSGTRFRSVVRAAAKPRLSECKAPAAASDLSRLRHSRTRRTEATV